MWFYKDTELNIWVPNKKLLYHECHNISHIQITTIIAENTENSSNSVANTIENIKFKIVRNSHLLSHKLAFSQVAQLLLHKQV